MSIVIIIVQMACSVLERTYDVQAIRNILGHVLDLVFGFTLLFLALTFILVFLVYVYALFKDLNGR